MEKNPLLMPQMQAVCTSLGAILINISFPLNMLTMWFRLLTSPKSMRWKDEKGPLLDHDLGKLVRRICLKRQSEVTVKTVKWFWVCVFPSHNRQNVTGGLKSHSQCGKKGFIWFGVMFPQMFLMWDLRVHLVWEIYLLCPQNCAFWYIYQRYSHSSALVVGKRNSWWCPDLNDDYIWLQDNGGFQA